MGRLGAIEHALSAQAISQKDADRQRDAVLRDHVAWLRQIADAPEPYLHGLLYPPAPAVEITRAQRASHAIDQARREGVQLSSPRPGVVEAMPRAKIAPLLHQMLADLAPEIAASLRAEIEVFETAAPEPASMI